MDSSNVPYMPSVKNLHNILDSIKHAAVPDGFGYDFLKDLGFKSSNDRSVIKLLKYLNMLDSSGIPQESYRQFVNPTKSEVVLAKQLKDAYDDLFISDKNAHEKSVKELTGWFKTKTGSSKSVSQKMASTFKSLTDYADFESLKNQSDDNKASQSEKEDNEENDTTNAYATDQSSLTGNGSSGLGLVYRFEIHLPDTQNIETYRAIFKAMREELGL